MLFASATEPSRNSIANLDYSEDPRRPRVSFESRSSTASYVQDNVLAPASSLHVLPGAFHSVFDSPRDPNPEHSLAGLSKYVKRLRHIVVLLTRIADDIKTCSVLRILLASKLSSENPP